MTFPHHGNDPAGDIRDCSCGLSVCESCSTECWCCGREICVDCAKVYGPRARTWCGRCDPVSLIEKEMRP
jgi:hypothetical protein